MLFTEHLFLDRFVACAKAGFRAVEYVSPYDYPPLQLMEILQQNQLQQALFNLPAGRWEQGERGIACLPDRVGEFQDGVESAISYASILGNPIINCLAGIRPEGLSRDVAWQTLVNNLRFAGSELAKAGLTLLVEPINCFDMPGFMLNTSADGIRAMDETGEPSVKLQYDIYHMQRMEGEVSSTIERLFSRIGHFQCAGVPGRTEPDRGELNYAHVFGLIDRLGYAGWIGAEYRPIAGTEQGLGWIKGYS
jgi:hydroxypyruvate isomerase